MMIRRSTACRCVRTSLGVFKLNQTCFVESSLVMRHRFLSTIRKPSTRAVSGSFRCYWGRRKQDSQNQKSRSCWSRSLMWGIDHSEFLSQGQTINQQGYKEILWLCFAQCAIRDESYGRTKLAASPRQCICSHCPEHPAVPGWEEHCRTGTTSLFTWSCSVQLCSFSQAWWDHQWDPFWRCRGHQGGRNDGAEGHPRRIIPAVHRSVVEKDGKGI